MADLNRTIDRATTISREVATLLEGRLKSGFTAYLDRVQRAQRDYLERAVTPKAPWDLWQETSDYAFDFFQRSTLFWDTLRQRGNNHIEHERAGKPPLLAYQHELLSDGRTFERPVNYALIRIIPPTGVKVDD